MAVRRALSRDESKSITRRRLLDAAAELLAKSSAAQLSASAVARAAAVAQPTFYVHFRDKDDLIRTLAEEQVGVMRARVRSARARFLAGEGIGAVRDTFRIPLEAWLAQPDLLRLHVQELHHADSRFGELARQLRADFADDLVADLIRLGMPARKKAERERVRMVADAMLAQTEALALGLIDGRYASVETAIDVLTRFALALLEWLSPDAASRESR